MTQSFGFWDIFVSSSLALTGPDMTAVMAARHTVADRSKLRIGCSSRLDAVAEKSASSLGNKYQTALSKCRLFGSGCRQATTLLSSNAKQRLAWIAVHLCFAP